MTTLARPALGGGENRPPRWATRPAARRGGTGTDQDLHLQARQGRWGTTAAHSVRESVRPDAGLRV